MDMGEPYPEFKRFRKSPNSESECGVVMLGQAGSHAGKRKGSSNGAHDDTVPGLTVLLSFIQGRLKSLKDEVGS